MEGRRRSLDLDTNGDDTAPKSVLPCENRYGHKPLDSDPESLPGANTSTRERRYVKAVRAAGWSGRAYKSNARLKEEVWLLILRGDTKTCAQTAWASQRRP
jgi:hypothetical protein